MLRKGLQLIHQIMVTICGRFGEIRVKISLFLYCQKCTKFAWTGTLIVKSLNEFRPLNRFACEFEKPRVVVITVFLKVAEELHLNVFISL